MELALVAVASNPPEAPEAPPTQMQVPEQPQIVTAPPPQQQPLIPPVRIVSHEGVVGTVGSPTAPTTYKIYDPDTKEDIDFYPISATRIRQIVHSVALLLEKKALINVAEIRPSLPFKVSKCCSRMLSNALASRISAPPWQRH